jgi:hypothetical protein
VRLIRAGSARHETLVAFLRAEAATWSYPALERLVRLRMLPPDAIVDSLARLVGNTPALWTVADDELIGAVRALDPACADLLGTPDGRAFLRKMSAGLAARRARQLVAGLFGGE